VEETRAEEIEEAETGRDTDPEVESEKGIVLEAVETEEEEEEEEEEIVLDVDHGVAREVNVVTIVVIVRIARAKSDPIDQEMPSNNSAILLDELPILLLSS